MRSNQSKGAKDRGRRRAGHPLARLLAKARGKLARLEPRRAHAAIQKGAVLIDTRPEFQRRADGEIPGAIVIERNHLEWRLHPASDARIPEAIGKDVRWIVLCDEGFSSSLAAASLQSIGLTRATDVIGGFKAWRAAGLPVSEPGAATPPRLANDKAPRRASSGTR
jgi:rhodanese-related sulfurtransferase